MEEIHEIDFPENDNWLDGPLPSSEPRPPSGWVGLERIMPALVKLFCRNNRQSALEFGVEYGYSTAVLAQLFNSVVGVDWFVGDEHSGEREDYFEKSKANLERWSNIRLVHSSYQEWIARDNSHYDLIHVDVVHTYDATYNCGLWSVNHAPVVIFHDTQFNWPDVRQAISRIAEETGKDFYNYPHCNGLGILL